MKMNKKTFSIVKKVVFIMLGSGLVASFVNLIKQVMGDDPESSAFKYYFVFFYMFGMIFIWNAVCTKIIEPLLDESPKPDSVKEYLDSLDNTKE